MNAGRLLGLAAIGALLAGGGALAQETQPTPPPATAGAIPAQAAEHEAEAKEDEWAFEASVFGYFVPDDSDFAQPTVTADRGWLHLEARYNYEDRNTASAWFGYNWSFGDELTLELTLMAGGVFGDTDGIAPGYRFTLGWKAFELSSESEYVFDTGSSSDSFFYTWSELNWSPADWCYVGLVVQRTKVYETEFDIQRGFLVGFSYKSASLTTYVFNPDASHPLVVVGFALSF